MDLRFESLKKKKKTSLIFDHYLSRYNFIDKRHQGFVSFCEMMERSLKTVLLFEG